MLVLHIHIAKHQLFQEFKINLANPDFGMQLFGIIVGNGMGERRLNHRKIEHKVKEQQ